MVVASPELVVNLVVVGQTHDVDDVDASAIVTDKEAIQVNSRAVDAVVGLHLL